MAIKGFTQADKRTGTAKKDEKPSKAKGSSLSQTFSAGKAGGMRYGATEGSSQPRDQRTNTGRTVKPPYVAPSNVYQAPGPAAGVAWAGVPTPHTYDDDRGTYTWDDPTGTGVRPRDINNTMGSGMTGAGADFGYTPQGLGMLYDNPGLLAGDVLGRLGIDNYGMNQMLGDALWPALYAYVMLNPNLAQQSDQDTFDYIANYMTQMTTPGGSVPSYDQLMNALMGVGAQDSDLGREFAMMTPQEQTAFIKQYAQAAAYGLNPLAQRMLGGSMDYSAQQYLGGVAKGNPDGSSYADYFQRNGLTGFNR